MVQKLLTKDETNELLAKAKYDKSAEALLVKHNLGLVGKIARSYTNRESNYADGFSVCSEGLLKAIRTWDPSRHFTGSFSSYACLIMHNEMRMLFRRNKKYQNTLSLNNIVYDDLGASNALTIEDTLEGNADLVTQTEIVIFLRIILENADKYLTKTEYQILSLILQEPGLTYKDACRRGWTLSQPQFSRVKSRLHKKIIKKWEIGF